MMQKAPELFPAYNALTAEAKEAIKDKFFYLHLRHLQLGEVPISSIPKDTWEKSRELMVAFWHVNAMGFSIDTPQYPLGETTAPTISVEQNQQFKNLLQALVKNDLTGYYAKQSIFSQRDDLKNQFIENEVEFICRLGKMLGFINLTEVDDNYIVFIEQNTLLIKEVAAEEAKTFALHQLQAVTFLPAVLKELQKVMQDKPLPDILAVFLALQKQLYRSIPNFIDNVGENRTIPLFGLSKNPDNILQKFVDTADKTQFYFEASMNNFINVELKNGPVLQLAEKELFNQETQADSIVGLLPQLYLRQENSEKLTDYLKNTVFKYLDPNNPTLKLIINLVVLYKNDQPSHDFKYSKPNLTEEQKFSEVVEKIDENIRELQTNNLLEKRPLLAALYNFKSNVLRNLNRYDEALKSCELALSHLQENKFSQAIIYSNIAGIYNAKGEYDKGLEYSSQSYDLIKTQLGKNEQENDSNKSILGCIANIYGYSLRKTKTSELDALKAAEVQRLALNLYNNSNVIRNNLAITLTKASDEGCQQEAIKLLEEQLQLDKQAGRYLFVTPYYLADACIRLAFLQLSENSGQINKTLMTKAQETLNRAAESLINNKSYEGAYRQKAEARVTRLRGVINKLLGKMQEAESCAVDSKVLMLNALGANHPKLSYFNKKVDDSITAEMPTLFFNHIPS